MKRTLSLILAALLLASAAVSCGKTEPAETAQTETNPAETNSPETTAAETDTSETVSETDAPAVTPLITEDGIAKAHIVLPDNASADERNAAEALAYHIKLVSGADVTVTNTPLSDSLPIMIGTPASLPEIEELFPEDMAWLRDIGKVGDMERYGEDGFSVRWVGDNTLDGKIYIFGVTPRGVSNGIYDFIEENLDVIWVKSSDDGIIYDEMPTITAIKADYREKSPFNIRTRAGNNILTLRNKHNTTALPYGGEHSVRSWVLSSPIYDPNNLEYWETLPDGTPMTATTTNQVNFWSELTADTIAASVIAFLDGFDDASRPTYINVAEEDWGFKSGVFPAQTLPFEYAPGQFVQPEDEAYASTVYFTFINRVAKGVAEKYPNVTINTLAYGMGLRPPVCDIEDNVSIWFCPMDEDLTISGLKDSLEIGEGLDGRLSSTRLYAEQFEAWIDKHPNVMIYTYYYVHYAQGWYERPLWYRFQNDFRYFAENGVLGYTICGAAEDGSDAIYTYQRALNDPNTPHRYSNDDAHTMNLLSYWLFYKLSWNPYEDVDALIVKFCDKVYGEASPYMQEYYRLLTEGWSVGTELLKEEFNMQVTFQKDQQYYYDYFLDVTTDDGVHIYSAIQEALTKAYEAAEGKAKEFISYPYEIYQDYEIILE